MTIKGGGGEFGDPKGTGRGKLSPFRYEEGLKARTSRTPNTMAGLRKLQQDCVLTELHVRIMKVLFQHEYLNAFLLRTALRQLPEPVDLHAETCRRLLNRLLRFGLLVRHELYREDEGGAHGRPFFYAVSSLGVRYLGSCTLGWIQRAALGRPFSIEGATERLAFNQFHIALLSQYYGKPALRRFGSQAAGGEKGVVLGYYEFGVRGGILRIMAFAFRLGPAWQKRFLERLRAVKGFAAERGVPPYCVVAACESAFQAMEAERLRRTDAMLRRIDVYYVCDRSVLAERGALSELIEVGWSGDYHSYRTFGINLD